VVGIVHNRQLANMRAEEHSTSGCSFIELLNNLPEQTEHRMPESASPFRQAKIIILYEMVVLIYRLNNHNTFF
jgi:hypothetical protein